MLTPHNLGTAEAGWDTPPTARAASRHLHSLSPAPRCPGSGKACAALHVRIPPARAPLRERAVCGDACALLPTRRQKPLLQGWTAPRVAARRLPAAYLADFLSLLYAARMVRPFLLFSTAALYLHACTGEGGRWGGSGARKWWTGAGAGRRGLRVATRGNAAAATCARPPRARRHTLRSPACSRGGTRARLTGQSRSSPPWPSAPPASSPTRWPQTWRSHLQV